MPIKRYYNNITDAYKKSSEEGVEVDYQTYSKIVKGFLKFLCSKLLSTGEVKLPCRLGEVQIRGYKQSIKVDEEGNIKGAAPDWKATKKLWLSDEEARKHKRLLYHFNEETEGVMYSYIWVKRSINLGNKSLYKLRFTRNNKKQLSTLVREGKEYMLKN